MLGVERRFLLLAATLGAAIWNAVNSLMAGGLIFGVLYIAGWLAGRHDQNLIGVVRYRGRYDAGLLGDRSPYVVIEGGGR